MRKNKKLSQFLSLVLSVALVFGMIVPAFAATGNAAGNGSAGNVGSANKVDLSGSNAMVNPNEEVRVSIVLEKASTIAAGYSTVDIADNKEAMSYRAGLRTQQAEVQKKIESKLGKELDVVWNLTLAANIISANVRRGDIESIEAVDGVKNVYVEKQYAPDVVSIGGSKEPNMAISGEADGAHAAWDAGYTGEGTLIAVIDTGLDTDHQSFANDAFLYAVDEANLKLTRDDVLAAAPELNATISEKGVATSYYRTEKVPFGWNYVDSNDEITHDKDTQGEHGSHVAGIAAANRFVDTNGDGVFEDALKAVQVAGNAPDAQLLVMKVFGKAGGAFDSDCVAAIEDAIYLKADSVNLSLGMAIPGFATPQSGDPYAEIQETLTSSDTVVVYSAGNAGSWAENTYNGYLYNDGVSFQFGGESGSYTNSFTVASVNNSGFIGATATANGVEFGWTDGSIGPDFRTLDPNENGTEYPFIMVDPAAAGQDDAIVAALGDKVKGAIYITWRGNTSFYQKGNAGANAGAVGVFVANNTSGTISMDLTGYTGKVPCASILQSDGLAIFEAGEVAGQAAGYDYITGTLTINGTVGAHAYKNEYYTMSNFSSWGTTGDLALKPEISAFGGNIYSVNGAVAGGKAYELMSGTSMAAPQISGMAALVQQYLRDNGIKAEGVTSRAMTMGLIMAAAEPMKDADGNYYSLLQQGAGLANVYNAISSPVYITVDGQNDGKVKAELGDDINRTGVYTVSFDIHNITGKAYTYKLDASAFTQAYFAEAGYGEFIDYATRYLDADVSFTIDDDLFVYEGREYDFDGDNDQDEDDAQLLLDHVILGTEIKYNADKMDVNGDGVVDTYDVHVLLNDMQPCVVVGGKETVHVEATITLTDDEKATLNEQNPDGAYVEAFITIQPVADEEGVLAPELSIPVLAYYGNWTDASMYEIGTGEEWAARTNNGKVGGRYPYTYQGGYTGYDLTLTNVLLDEEGYPILNGASAGAQGTFMDYMYTQIRNSGNGVVQITDQDGNVLWRSADLGANYGVTYYENAGFWTRPSLTGSLYYNLYNFAEIDWAAATANVTDDVTDITISLILAPEYYAQYDYDWDALTDGDPANGELGKGAYLSTTLSIDLESPVIGEIKVEGDDPANRTITVDLTDNKQLSVARLYDESGNANNFTAAVRRTGYESKTLSGTSATVTFNGGDSGSTTGYLYDSIYRVEVEDASGNVATLRFAVGDTQFTETPETVTVSETSIEMVKGSTRKLSAEVGPFNLTDEAKAVTWSSADESIAKVDANGVVTAVGKGNTTITASTVYNGANGSPVTAVCQVEVFTLPITATGVLGDAEGYAKFFTWDFEEGVLDYSDASASEVVYPQAVTTYDDDTFLAVDGDGTIYLLDYEGNELDSSVGVYDGYLPYDMDYTEERGFWWTMGGFLINEPDPMNPELYGFNLAKYGEYIGMAISEESFDVPYNGIVHVEFVVYLLNTDNQIVEVWMYNGGENALILTTDTDLTAKWVGYGGESYSNMVLGADGNLYVSIMTGDTNEVYQISYWEDVQTEEYGYTALSLGDFGDAVWPGLFLTVGNKPTGVENDFDNDGDVDADDAMVILRAVVRETATMDMDINGDGIVTTRDAYALLKTVSESNSVVAPKAYRANAASAAKSVSAAPAELTKSAEAAALDSVIKLEKTPVKSLKATGGLNSFRHQTPEVDQPTHTVTVPLTANEVENGLLLVGFDTDILTYAGYTNETDSLVHVYAKDDVVRVGFAGLDKINDETVVNLTFTYEAAAEDRVAQFVVNVLEDGDYVVEPQVLKFVDVTLEGEELTSYTLTGILTDDYFNVHQFTYNTSESVKYDNTFSTLQNPVVAANVDDSTYYVIDYNWDTEVYDLYLVNKEDGSILETNAGWGDPEDIVPWDLAYLGDDFGMWGVYGYYLITDIETEGVFDYAGAFNLSAYGYFLSVTVVDEPWTAQSSSSGVQTGDRYLLALSTDGNVYKFMPYPTATGFGVLFNSYSYTNLPDLWYDVPWATDEVPGTSLVVDDDGALYFSCIDADLEATVMYRLTLEGSKYVAEKIGETDYWVYPALLLGASVNDNANDDDDDDDDDEPKTSPVDLTFNGIVQEYDGIYWAEITTANGPEYRHLNEISNWIDGNPMLTTAAVDLWNETLYSATMELDDTAVFYEVDPVTFNTNEIGTSQFAYTDMADAMGLNYESGGNYVVASYGPYVLLVNATTGQYEGVLWASGGEAADGPDIVGVAFAGLTQYQGKYADVYYLVDTEGDLHLIAFIYIDIGKGASFYSLSFNDTDDYDVLMNTGYTTDINIYNSLYYVFGDDTNPGYIVWSCLNYDEDKVDLIVIDEDTNDVYNIGSFDEGVWPVGGLVTLADASNSVNALNELTASVPAVSSISKVDLDKNALTKPMTVKGSLNSIEVVEADDESANGIVVDQNEKTVTVPVTAENSTNGEFILAYDEDVLTLDLTKVLGGDVLTSIKVENGEIHVGYAGKTAVNGNVLTAVFSYETDDDTTSFSLEVIQDGEDKNLGTTEQDAELNHRYGEPTYTWSTDNSTVTATVVCENDPTHVVTETVETTYKVVTAATTEAEGKGEYTAVFECELFETQTKTVVIEKLPQETPEVPELNLGDINLDGEVTCEDARLALRQAVKLENYAPDSQNFRNGDVNFSGDITAEDARSILRASVKLEDPADWLANMPK